MMDGGEEECRSCTSVRAFKKSLFKGDPLQVWAKGQREQLLYFEGEGIPRIVRVGDETSFGDSAVEKTHTQG